MYKNKSPYSHVPHPQNKYQQVKEAPPSPLSIFAQAINTKQQHKRQSTAEYSTHNGPTLIKGRSNTEINLECNEVLISPNFQKDLTCN